MPASLVLVCKLGRGLRALSGLRTLGGLRALDPGLRALGPGLRVPGPGLLGHCLVLILVNCELDQSGVIVLGSAADYV
ncbi:hypothetical protein FKP32DRAFT_1591956 [Trametes sanguinea]|nr:hypothetical protein FKP32DRAFT_1591956 [Trametes sanguinea]